MSIGLRKVPNHVENTTDIAYIWVQMIVKYKQDSFTKNMTEGHMTYEVTLTYM